MRKWVELPAELRTKEVRPYYEYLYKKRKSLAVKRAFDIVMSIALLIVLMPVMAGIAVLIKLDSAGPVFHRQIRSRQIIATFGLLSSGQWCKTQISLAGR